ncbi:NAD(+) synthase [Planctomycetaceae bacterium SH139]
MGPHGFLRIACFSPRVSVANPQANLRAIQSALSLATDADILLFPELAITGYSCGDLFAQQALLNEAIAAVLKLAQDSRQIAGLIVVGCPLQVGSALYNTAVVIQQGRLLAVVPKQHLPSYREFYETRWFRPATGQEPESIQLGDQAVPFGIDLLVAYGQALVGIEICEDLWTPIPPSSRQALAGAQVLLNLSASNELIGKAEWRTELVISQAGRCLAAYAYASAGPSESTTDLVFSGHCLIAENGRTLASQRALDGKNLPQPSDMHVQLTADVDLELLAHERRLQNTFLDPRGYRVGNFRHVSANAPVVAAASVVPSAVATGKAAQASESQRSAAEHSAAEHSAGRASRWQLRRTIAAQPFVPASATDLRHRCEEILAIQVAALTKRLTRLPDSLSLAIGVSGGLDSTLALLVACQACDALGWERQRISGLTMPGFGTSETTRRRAETLMNLLRVDHRLVDIRTLCLDTFRALGHRPFGIDTSELKVDQFQAALGNLATDRGDLTFENVQARVRTLVLMNQGFVLGTGDLSEQALGWSTYNGDHMSMYNVNCSIPKTLVRFLVRHAADQLTEGPLFTILQSIAAAPITPELLPLGRDGESQQDTEAVLGPYELHDFFLYHFVRYGCGREKILFLASQADFSQAYTRQQIADTLDTFFRRFFHNQFKRSCVPDGPKVGTVSLSPRGDWRMPSDADPDAFRT